MPKKANVGKNPPQPPKATTPRRLNRKRICGWELFDTPDDERGGDRG